MASKPSEAALLNDIASLAALINKHKSAAQAPLPFGPYSYSSSSYKLPPPVTQKKFSNLSLKPQSLVPLQPNTTPVIQTQQLIHKNPYKLVKPKPIPNIPPATTAIPPSTKQTRPATPNSYIRRGNKLVRKSILKLQTSPHKKFILKSPSATKSISSSPSIRVKQMMANAQSPGLYKRHLTLNPALASRKPVSLLTAYFRLSKNSLVRKTSNKYIRPGAVIAIKKPLVKTEGGNVKTPIKGNRMTIDGQVYIRTGRGKSLVRSKKPALSSPFHSKPTPHSMNRVLASHRVKRSLKLARTKNAQYCLFYNKFGKCNRKETCRYVHDPDKVAVCRNFLKGKCEAEPCLLQHKIDSDRMPTCWQFLQGVCNKDNCPYSHVYVNPQAEICPDFRNGYCPNGKSCKLKHVDSRRPKKDTDIKKEGQDESENKDAVNRQKRKRVEEEEKIEEEAKRRREERPNFSALFGTKEKDINVKIEGVKTEDEDISVKTEPPIHDLASLPDIDLNMAV